ncbi:hypothetical protein [Burkholderia cenocepacia]|uniref:hypothetical protein n=1 Tax=Burkholderia cenocepacia TaxID=95486 RepID=UPI00286F89F3|nr:hypothetical protein [Burkholderia cenocepacia]
MATLSKYSTGFAGGMFDAVWAEGGVQGEWLPDPSTRYSLEGGVSAEPTALFGGCAISVAIAGKGQQIAGGSIKKATGASDLDGFIVSSKMYHAVVEAQDTAPQVAQGDGVHFARLGSRVRLYVNVDPAFAETLYGAASDTKVAYDLTKQQLVASGGTAIDLAGVKVESVFASGIVMNYDATADRVSYAQGPVAVIRL